MLYFVKRLLVFILTFFFNYSLIAQQHAKTVSLFYEKVYLHTDRDTYASGEDIWFKAYLVNAQNYQPIDYSHNLYVELISPGLNITLRRVLRLECGLGSGDMKLPDTLSAGNYRLRAYTNWMRNFGDNFVFEKSIRIVNSLGTITKAIVKDRPKSIKKKSIVTARPDTLPDGPVVSFFPEGGSLVNDVRSVVAVKAGDVYGKGIAVTGDVVASSGRTVAQFVCDSLGMGRFTIVPDETQKYHAEVKINNVVQNFKMPNAWHKGFVLGVSTTQGSIATEISCNGFALNDFAGRYLTLEARHANKIYYKQQVPVVSNSMLIQIADQKFPEGIASITLYDDHAKPLNERLVYVHHEENYPKLTLSTDKAVYGPKGKVIVKIKLSDTTKAHLSLSAVDAGVVSVQPENITGYLTLRSELKGTIEHPERYFENSNTNRFKQLDLLLLTQGWRDFVWKKIAAEPANITYEVETGLPITGQVRRMWANKPMPKMNITMFAPKAAKEKLFVATSDTSGRFTIDGAILYGYQYVNFTSRDFSGKADTHKNGWIRVDSLFLDKMPVNAADAEPDPVSKPDSLLEREKLKQKFSFTGNNLLNTVQIKGRSNVTTQVLPITLTEQKEYGSLMQYLLYKIPASHMEFSRNGLPILENGYFPPYPFVVGMRGVYADKSKIDYSTVSQCDYTSLSMEHVLKVTIHATQDIFLTYFVELVLRPGVLGVHDIFDNTVADIVGYNKAREFYAPKYITPDEKPDYRSTLHWEPNITTDKNGEATVTFYNADPKTTVRLMVEGLNEKGQPINAAIGYSVR